MKKTFIALAVLASLNCWAQYSPDNVSGTLGAPGKLNLKPVYLTLEAFATRIHTLNIEEKISFMEKQNLTESKRVAVFNVAGALAYDHEIADVEFFNETSQAGRNAGFQIVPYTISVSSDKKYFITASAVGFKNMNSEMQDCDMEAYRDRDCDESGFRYIDNLEIMKVEYNKNFTSNSMEERHLRIVQMDAKFDLLQGDFENQFLALKVGAAPVGAHLTKVKLITNEEESLDGFESSIRYGLEYNVSTKKGLRINSEVVATHQWSLGKAFDKAKLADFEKVYQEYRDASDKYANDKAQYSQDMANWQSDKEIYENTYLNGTHISDESYIALSHNQKPSFNEKKPVEPSGPNKEDIMRSYVFLTPKIEFSKNINPEGSPVRIGMRFSANIPLTDKITGAGRNLDLKKKDNPLMINAGVFINF